MTYEQPPQPPENEAPGADDDHVNHADAYVVDIVANAPTPAEGRSIAALYARYGTAFALYLALDGVDRYIPDNGADPTAAAAEPSTIETDFKDAYYGRFLNREAIIDDTIASFDWGIELQRLLIGHPQLQSVIRFDRDAIWTFVNEYYEVYDGTDGLYLFERWP